MPSNWTEYISSYRKAADLLAQKCIDERRNNDLLIYPIVNSYLQYLELILKEILLNCHIYLQEDARIRFNHDIINLWDKCRHYLEQIDEQVIQNNEQLRLETATIYDSIKIDLESISSLDPNRQSSRYPIDRDGNPISMGRMNIAEIKAIIDRLSGQLEGLSCGAYEYESVREQQLSEHIENSNIQI